MAAEPGVLLLGDAVVVGTEVVGTTVPGWAPFAGVVVAGDVAACVVVAGAAVAGVVVVPWTRADAGIEIPRRVVLVWLVLPAAIAPVGAIEPRAATAITQSAAMQRRRTCWLAASIIAVVMLDARKDSGRSVGSPPERPARAARHPSKTRAHVPAEGSRSSIAASACASTPPAGCSASIDRIRSGSALASCS